MKNLLAISSVWALRESALNDDSLFRTESETFVGTEAEIKQAKQGRPPRAKGGIAYLSLAGTITQKGAYWGGTSSESFGRAFDAAMANDKVGAIVIETDSPGGDVRGTAELADKVFNARGNGKDIIAHVNSDMHSAALWIGSAADQVFITSGGSMGSHGVWTVHQDVSQLLENEGVKITLIHAGKHKVDGNPFGPLPDEVKASIQADVDEINDQFTAALARNYGVSKTHVLDNFGQGKSFSAEESVKRGMAHGIRTFENLLGAMAGRGSTKADAWIERELCSAFFNVELPKGRSTAARKRLLELEG